MPRRFHLERQVGAMSRHRGSRKRDEGVAHSFSAEASLQGGNHLPHHPIQFDLRHDDDYLREVNVSASLASVIVLV
jgi:hypothetical protein